MSMQKAIRLSLAATTWALVSLNNTRAADVIVTNSGSETYDVAVALTSPGFKTERDGIIRRNQQGLFRIGSNISNSHPWDLVVWKRAGSQMDWRFSTAFRIPNENLDVNSAMAILSIDPSMDRVSLAYAAPGPEGMGSMRTIEPWTQGVNNDEDSRPNLGVRLGVNAYKCQTGIHIQSVTAGTAATRCVDQQSGQPASLETGDHVLTVNGATPRDISEFQSLIRNSPRTIELRVLDARTRQTRNLTTNLW